MNICILIMGLNFLIQSPTNSLLSEKLIDRIMGWSDRRNLFRLINSGIVIFLPVLGAWAMQEKKIIFYSFLGGLATYIVVFVPGLALTQCLFHEKKYKRGVLVFLVTILFFFLGLGSTIQTIVYFVLEIWSMK